MNNCKVCGKEIKHNSPVMLEGFCGEICLGYYLDINLVEVETQRVEQKLIRKSTKQRAKTNDEIHWDLIKSKVEKYSQFRISNKTLEPYNLLKSWGEFLLSNNLIVVRDDDQISIIKRSIL